MIRVERRARGIVWVVFDRPQARNAMTFAMWADLRTLAEQLAADEGVRVVVFTGAGGAAFVSGTDIGEFRAFASDGESSGDGSQSSAGTGSRAADEGVAYEARMDGVMAALEAIPVPTIAAIGGACTGGGVSVAAACDLRIGAPGTRIGVPIARTLGNCLSLANVARVAELIGLDRVKMLLLTGRLLDADDALRAGFLTELVQSDDMLPAHAQATAEALTELAPLTLRATKEMIRRLRAAQPSPPDEDLIRSSYGSEDFRTGVNAFLEKRHPNWTGR